MVVAGDVRKTVIFELLSIQQELMIVVSRPLSDAISIVGFNVPLE